MKKILFVLCAAAATLVACNKAEVVTPVANDDARVVKFETQNLYSFDTKAPIAAGLHVGIYATSPATGGANADYEVEAMPVADPVASGTLSGSAIKWGLTQVGTSTTSKFFAMYPYENSSERNSFNESTSITYRIANDGDEAYAKDFLVDVVDAAPGDDVENPAAVSFSLEHPFALLRVAITNTSDDAIQKVEISGVKKEGTLAYNTAAITATETAAVTLRNMPKESEVGNVITFYSVIVPQTASPVIKVTTWTNATSTYNLATSQAFVAGNQYTANIAYSHTHAVATSNLSTTLNFNVEDWTANNLNSGNNIANNDDYSSSTTTWPILKGVGFGSTWESGIRMKCVANNSYRLVITKSGDVACKVYTEDGTWYGFSSNETVDGWTKISTSKDGGAANLTLTTDNGTYTVYFYSDTEEVWIKAGDVTR